MGALIGTGRAWTPLAPAPAAPCIERSVAKAQEQSPVQGPAPDVGKLPPSLPWERWWWDQSGLGMLDGLQTCYVGLQTTSALGAVSLGSRL